MNGILKLVRYTGPRRLSFACTGLAVVFAVMLSHLFWYLLTGAVPDGLTIVAGGAAAIVAMPMVHVFVIAVYSLNVSNENLIAAEAKLRDKIDELAIARDALSTLNHELEGRVARRTEVMRGALAEAERANAAQSAFLANMSHELRTPLNAIIGYAELIGDRKMLFGDLADEKIDDYAAAIRSSGKHLNAMVGDLLDLSTIELSQYKMIIDPVCVKTILQSVVDELTPIARSRDQRIDVLVPVDSVTVETDAHAVRQIMMNLLTNALKYSDDGAIVSVMLDCESGDIDFTVVDSGVGMSDLSVVEATQPFSKFSDAHIAAGQSIGLGLAIVKRLCLLLGGKFDLRSAEGQGTTARVGLPACKRAALENEIVALAS